MLPKQRSFTLSKVAMEYPKHQVRLDGNKCMTMFVKVTLECHKLQVSLDINNGMYMVFKVTMECHNFFWNTSGASL